MNICAPTTHTTTAWSHSECLVLGRPFVNSFWFLCCNHKVLEISPCLEVFYLFAFDSGNWACVIYTFIFILLCYTLCSQGTAYFLLQLYSIDCNSERNFPFLIPGQRSPQSYVNDRVNLAWGNHQRGTWLIHWNQELMALLPMGPKADDHSVLLCTIRRIYWLCGSS